MTSIPCHKERRPPPTKKQKKFERTFRTKRFTSFICYVIVHSKQGTYYNYKPIKKTKT